MTLFQRAWHWLRDDAALQLLISLDKKVTHFMTQLDDALAAIKGDLDTMRTNVSSISTRLQAQSDQITQLQAALAGTSVSQTALDLAAVIKAEADALVTDTAALVPAPPAAPTA